MQTQVYKGPTVLDDMPADQSCTSSLRRTLLGDGWSLSLPVSKGTACEITCLSPSAPGSPVLIGRARDTGGAPLPRYGGARWSK